MIGPRIGVTGIGVVTPLGSDLERYWDALCAGRSGIGPITAFATDGYTSTIAASVGGFDPEQYIPKKDARRLDRCAQFAVAAARLAAADADLSNLPNPHATAACIGSGFGCLATTEAGERGLLQEGPRRMSPFQVAMMLPNMPVAQVSIQLGLRGPCLSVSTACATGLDNVAAGMDLIRRGAAEIVLAGGAEAIISPLGVAAFAAARALSRRNDDPEHASRPFDRHRDGFVIGEGAGVVVLETLDHARARGARVRAEIVGYGSTSDAYHITAPREDGEGLVAAIRIALGDAGLAPEAVDYVNAHGTSTPLGDVVETRAIRTAFGAHAYRVAVNSTKSMIGHLLGAAGTVELATTILSLEKQYLHPTANLEEADPECDLDYVPRVGRPAALRIAMCNSLAFGGHNASCVVARI